MNKNPISIVYEHASALNKKIELNITRINEKFTGGIKLGDDFYNTDQAFQNKRDVKKKLCLGLINKYQYTKELAQSKNRIIKESDLIHEKIKKWFINIKTLNLSMLNLQTETQRMKFLFYFFLASLHSSLKHVFELRLDGYFKFFEYYIDDSEKNIIKNFEYQGGMEHLGDWVVKSIIHIQLSEKCILLTNEEITLKCINCESNECLSALIKKSEFIKYILVHDEKILKESTKLYANYLECIFAAIWLSTKDWNRCIEFRKYLENL
jgi:hypothetical protein